MKYRPTEDENENNELNAIEKPSKCLAFRRRLTLLLYSLIFVLICSFNIYFIPTLFANLLI